MPRKPSLVEPAAINSTAKALAVAARGLQPVLAVQVDMTLLSIPMRRFVNLFPGRIVRLMQRACHSYVAEPNVTRRRRLRSLRRIRASPPRMFVLRHWLWQQ